MASMVKLAYRCFSTASQSLFTSNSLLHLAERLKSKSFSKISFVLGAGISVNANIPDFRSPSSGLYSQMESLGLPFPEAIFDINYFKMDPEPFFKVFPTLKPPDARPTLSHFFIKLLEEKGLLLMCYTQNIDGLEKKAGVSAGKVVAAHGSAETSHCTSCGDTFDSAIMEDYLAKKTPAYCHCGGLAKPDVVFFGEKLPWEFHAKSELISYSDLLFIVGTSLAVFPFASLVDMVPTHTPRVVFNLENNDSYSHAGFNFESSATGSRDLLFTGDCDQNIKELVRLAGWQEDLDKLIMSYK